MSTQTIDRIESMDGLPEQLTNDFSESPKLTREQCGHLRHFHNLANSLDGEWALMGTQEPAQEWLDAYRYQLAVMAYGAGAAHYHRLPAMRSVFKPLMKRLISKMLRREVWGYWYLTSQSGVFADPDLKELRKPWSDPICRENIMYSGHLLLMISLYSMLFNDDTYDKKDSLVFLWNPIFWGMGPEKFTYNRTTLQKAIVNEMERTNWMGVCCEPNSVFVVCNQFPLIAMRYNDVRNGTNEVGEVLEKYKNAWAKRGFVGANGVFRDWYRPKQDDMVDGKDLAFTAWACAMMNSWNSAYTHKLLPSLSIGFLTKTSDNRVNVNQLQFALAVRSLITEDNSKDPNSSSILIKAREIVDKQGTSPAFPFSKPTFGYVAKWLSEVGSPDDLEALLRHADMFLNPTWAHGGLYYPRCDERFDTDGNWKNMDPFTGNAAIGYARLNVSDGQKIMWEQPWSAADVETRPWIDEVGLENGIDALRGRWDEEKQAMIASIRTWDGRVVALRPVVRCLPMGLYGVYVNGRLVERREVIDGEDVVAVDLEIGVEEVNLVVLKAGLNIRAVL